MKYSAQDISDMRRLCVDVANHRSRRPPSLEAYLRAEAMLVTYMGNETTAQELRDALGRKA